MSKLLGVMVSPVLNRSWYEGECTLRSLQCLTVTWFPERIKKTSLVRKNLVYLKPYLCQAHLFLLICNPAKLSQTDSGPGLSVQGHAPTEGCYGMSRKQPDIVGETSGEALGLSVTSHAFPLAPHSLCRTAVTTSRHTHVCTCGH